jgi:hypothetical protein
VSEMLKRTLKTYIPYFKTQENKEMQAKL